jgi:hypothetical protein
VAILIVAIVTTIALVAAVATSGGVHVQLYAVLSTPPASASSSQAIHGDTWDGNVVSDGNRLYLLSREEIDGFWGVASFRTSDDDGLTWEDPTSLSDPLPNAARPALTMGPDGSFWAAWAKQGPVVASQALILRRSLDGGATWTAPVRLSDPSVGLVGLPALVATDRVHLVAYTDGTTGDVIVQRMDREGHPDGGPVIVGRTTEELYSNAQFFDGGLSMAAIDDHVTLVYVDGSIGQGGAVARALVSTDAGRTWHQAWSQERATAEPLVVARNGRFVALTAGRTQGSADVRAIVSTDGGATWIGAGKWAGQVASILSVSTGSDRVNAGWVVCDDLRCTRTQFLVGDVASGLTNPQRLNLGDLSLPVGIALTKRSMVIASLRESPSGRAEDRSLVFIQRPLP